MDAELVRGLIEDARDFWPAAPEGLPQMDAWLERAEEVLGRRAEHESELASLRAIAEPYRDGDRRRDHAATLEQLATLAREVEGLAALVARSNPDGMPAPLDPDAVRARDKEVEALLLRPPREIVSVLLAKIASLMESTRDSPDRWERDLAQVRAFHEIAERCARALEEQTTVRFDSPLDAWRFGALRRLLADWDALTALTQRVRRQRNDTERLVRRTAAEGTVEWDRAVAAIAASPHYRGLRPEWVFGLLPLREDPHSGLWEFVLATTGDVPVRDDTTPSGWRIAGENGIVLVLLPGGSSVMGQPKENTLDRPESRPTHVVELDPFLVSKFELTRAQAERLGLVIGPALVPEELCLPMTLDWHRSRALLAGVGLCLPTEAQWEYAARGGSLGPDWPLKGCANVMDKTLAEAWRRQGYYVKRDLDAFEDGWVDSAPVGTFAANGFGLHDTLGNVAEWCRDPFVWRGYASLIPRSGDGLRDTVAVEGNKAVRGGSCIDAPEMAQPWVRHCMAPATVHTGIGLRPVMPIRMR